MRALIISAVLFTVVVIFVFSSSAWLSGFFSKLLVYAEDLPEINSPDSSKKINETLKCWNNGKGAVLLFFHKEKIDKIDGSLNKLAVSYKEDDEKEYNAAKNELLYEIGCVIEMIEIKHENIF